MLSKIAIILGSMILILTQAGKCPFGYGGGDSKQKVAVNLNQLAGQQNLQMRMVDLNETEDSDKQFDKDSDGDDNGNSTEPSANTTDSDDASDNADQNSNPYSYPSDVLKCPANKTQVQATNRDHYTKATYATQFKDVVDHMEALDPADQTAFAACMVRLAGHDFMDFRLTKGGKSSTGGADGCMNFNDPDNKGLAQCLIRFKVNDIFQKYCDKLSLADFIVVMGEMVISRLETHYNADDPFNRETLAFKFRENLMIGRQTLEKCPNAVGLMPNPEEGCEGLKRVFIDNIFKTKFRHWHAWRAVAAISGAHTLGQAHLNNSGYDGHWSTPADQGKFNNGYYKSLLSKGWGPQKHVNGNSKKNQWQRIDQLPCNQDFHEMMLTTDMCLAYQFNTQHAECMKKEKRNVGKCNKFQRKGRFLNAKTDSCCAWTNVHVLTHKRFGPVLDPNHNDYCGVNAKNGDMRNICCQHEAEDSIGDCDAFNWPKGVMFDWILKFAGHEQEFYKHFLEAWRVATENGFPKPLGKIQ